MRIPLLALAAALAMLAGCPAPGTGAKADTAAADGKFLVRLAGVEQIEIVVMESRPVQVRVAVYGWMSDACTTIRNFAQTRDGTLIRLKIITTRPAGVMCAQVIKRFRDTYPVQTRGLASGTYTLDVNGKRKDFTLP